MRLAALILILATIAQADTTNAMLAMKGQPYSNVSCYDFLYRSAKQAPCKVIRTGCEGRMKIVEEFHDAVILSIFEDELKPGDVAVFLGGGHVAAYLGNHLWMDSTPRGVQEFRLLDRAPFDYWYNPNPRTGKIQILRWRNK